MYQGGGRGGGAPARGANQGAVPQGASSSAKLIISNLHFNVSNQDVKASHRTSASSSRPLKPR
jgi:hypothetical protein